MPTMNGSATQTEASDEPVARGQVARRRLRALPDRLPGSERLYSAIAARLRGLRSFPGLMLLVCVALAAPIASPLPTPGLDNSWKTGLNIARQHGLKFGSDVVFTFGPWGFLDYPLAVSRVNLVAGSVFAIFAVACGWIAFYGALRRRASEPVAAVAAAWLVTLATVGMPPSTILLAAATLAAMEYVGSSSSGDRHGWVPAAAASCSALLVQVKFSEGLVLGLIALACLIFAPRRPVRRAGEAIVGFVVISLLAWSAAGQQLGDLPSWVRGSVQVAGGYTDAMAKESKPNVGGYVLMIAVALVVVGYLARMALTRSRKATLGVLTVAALILLLGFRQGFDRHDGSHQRYFFALALPVLAWFLASARSLVFRAATLAVVVLLAAVSWLPTEPHTAVARGSMQLQLVVDGKFQANELGAAKAAARNRYALSPQMRAAVTGHPITIDPTEINLAWAYNLDWRPAVVFQTYSAYSAELDQRNADFLADAAPDQEILRSPTSIDGRNPLWDPPRYVLTELCDYRVEMSDTRWMLLRKSENRCSAPGLLSRRWVAAGQPVTPPKVGADQVLVMSFRADRPGLQVRLGRLLDKSFHPLTVTTLDGHRFRLPRGLADGPLLVNVPKATGWPTRFGGSTVYRSVAFSEPGTVTFSVIDLTGSP